MTKQILRSLRKADEQVEKIWWQIKTVEGLKGRPGSGCGRRSGISDPTQKSAEIALKLEEMYKKALDEQLHWKRQMERIRSRSKPFEWELIWDHYYTGYPWKTVGRKHLMSEEAAKTRVCRYLKKLEALLEGM